MSLHLQVKRASGPASPAAADAAVCEACGRGDALFMGGRWICADCISVAGSCCPEFGAWDAWSSPSGVVPKCYGNHGVRAEGS